MQHWVDSAATVAMAAPVVGGIGKAIKNVTIKSVVTKAAPNLNEVNSLQRVGSALKNDKYHAFPDIVDNFAEFAVKSPIPNGTLYQLPGAYKGLAGRFEWIIQDGVVTHRLFVKGGGINGIPIIP